MARIEADLDLGPAPLEGTDPEDEAGPARKVFTRVRRVGMVVHGSR